MTTIELTDDEAEAFKFFRLHQGTIEQIIASKMLEVKAGQATVHFGADGRIMQIVKQETVYRFSKR